MRKDYRLYELGNEEFENLVVRICNKWFGPATTPFAAGKDGGRDSRFNGTAVNFPNAASQWSGFCVFQAKHVSSPDKSCSDKDFAKLIAKEHKKVKQLVKDKICDYYVVFTNRKLTAGADKTILEELRKLGVKDVLIVGVEMLHSALQEFKDIADSLPNLLDIAPFRFDQEVLAEVISALHDYVDGGSDGNFDSAHDLDYIKIKAEKNRINGLTQDFYEQIIIPQSMPHFASIDQFLKNPRNKEYAGIYYDSADELKQKILLRRSDFENFDEVFVFLYDEIQRQKTTLKGKRRMISVLLHYMYFNCDIGSKDSTELGGSAC